MSSAAQTLSELFSLEQRMLECESKFLESQSPDALIAVLRAAVSESFKSKEPEEQAMRLRRVADLAAQIDHAESPGLLLTILDHEDPAVRTEAGEALLDVAYERFKVVANAIEGLISKGHTGLSMEELPFILAEIREPDPVPLISKFLSSQRADVVASAIEALAGFGSVAAVAQLQKLVDDGREVTVPDLDDEKTTIGDLARDAIEELTALED